MKNVTPGQGTEVAKREPAWHAEAARLIRENHAKVHRGFLRGAKKATWFGLLLQTVKEHGKADGSIPHGQFMAWRQKHVPELEDRTAQFYMTMARKVIERAGVSGEELVKFGETRRLPKKVVELVEGKTQKQLLLDFRRARADDDDGLETQVGRAPGEGGGRKLTMGEKTEAQKRDALRAMEHAALGLCMLGAKFVVVEDQKLWAFLGMLEAAKRGLTTWLNQPVAERDAQKIEDLLRGQLGTPGSIKKLFRV